MLRAKLAKLQGKLQGAAKMRALAAAKLDAGSIRQESEKSISELRLAHLRLSVRASDLRLLMMRHERAQANLHAAR